MVERTVGGDFDAVESFDGSAVESSDDKGKEIGGHFGGLFEKCCKIGNISRGETLSFVGGHVGENNIISVWHRDG